nr:hypothetical protein [Tanacetum cinerariifolium]GEX86764.1 hypothetical protein [Tanacetum cinerariifolium]
MNENKSDGGESRDEGAGGEMTSSIFFYSQSINSKSCRDSVSKKEAQAGVETYLISNVDINAVKGNITSQGVNDNKCMNTIDEIGPIPMPVSKNLILSSRSNPDVSLRILKRMESLVYGGNNSNETFSFNNVEKWPSLSRNNGIDVNGDNADNGSGVRDEVMKESLVGMKHVSFVDAVQGRIRNLIIMDRITTKMCDRSYGRASFARVPIEVDVDLGYLKRTLNVAKKKLNMGENTQRTANVVHGDNSDIGWKTMNNRKSGRNDDTNRGMYRQRNYYIAGSSRGGLNGRGRGGMNGIMVGDQRFNNNVGARYVPIKKNEAVGPVSDNKSDKNEKSKNKVNEGKFSRDKGIETEMLSERMNVDERVFNITIKIKNEDGKNINENGGSSKGNAKKGFDSQNMFSVLSDAAEIEKRLEWEFIRERINEACEKRLRIKSKMKEIAMVKSVMIEKGLTENQAYGNVYDKVYRDEHDRIDEMIIKKQLVKAELFFKLGKFFLLLRWKIGQKRSLWIR